jgi:hypothetical protein
VKHQVWESEANGGTMWCFGARFACLPAFRNAALELRKTGSLEIASFRNPALLIVITENTCSANVLLNAKRNIYYGK